MATDIDRIQIPSEGLLLEAVLHRPQVETAGIVVICHPHPQYGGSMDNNVVMAAVEGVLVAGLAALRFNFRGVGRSGGAYDNGRGEREDVRAALAWARSQPGTSTVALAGYSFGAGMAAAVVDDSIASLALIAPPAGSLQREDLALRKYRGSVLITAGDRDPVAKSDVLEAVKAELGPQVELEIVPGVDHSWWGYEDALAARISVFFDSPPPAPS